MPVSCKLRDGKYRIVEPSGKIAKTKKGNAVDGGGHNTKEKCQKQARAINRNLKDNKMDDSKSTSAPLKACIFSQDCEVTFAEIDDEKKTGQFRMTAYSGGIIAHHGFWGNVAFDLEGIKFAKKKTPVLEEHLRDSRIGFSTKQEVKDSITLEGKFLSNIKAQTMKKDIADGFPMQASVLLWPDVIEYVEKGEQVEVNGHILKGPGTVFRKAKIKEVSMCTIGADSHTQSKVFNEADKEQIQFNILQKEQKMDEQTQVVELTAETFSADNPDLFAEITAAAKAEGVTEGVTEGENAEKERFSQICELAKDDPAFVVLQFAGGKSVAEAKSALITRLRSQKDKAVEAAKTKTAATKKVDPAHQEFSDEQTEGQTESEKSQTPKEKYTAEFNASKNIQTEFGGAEGLDDYIAFRKAEDAGLARTSSK